MNAVKLAESGFIPTWMIRYGIRQRLKQKLELESRKGKADRESLIQNLKTGPIAIATDEANDQHYQVPTAFYQLMLGPKMKYSACYWPESVTNLEAAETASLELVAARARIEDGMQVLELGCGWGSFSLWAAEKFPRSTFLAVSNSLTQADYIRNEATRRKLQNLQVLTENVVSFHPASTFDRVVSIEMFEHMRNYEALMQRVSAWLNPGGKCFVHIFSHRHFAYPYESSDENDWMSNYFFTGGMMPSHDLLPGFDKHLVVEDQWRLNGQHYSRTLESWLQRLDDHADEVLDIFQAHYGKEARTWINRWRMFLLACSELFAYGEGEEWGISHYRFTKRKD